MPGSSSSRSRRQVPVVLAAAALSSLASVSRAAGLTLPELGAAAFFISGIAQASLGESAYWFVLGAAVLSIAFRLVEIESWAHFISGGLIGRADEAFGPRSVALAAAATLVERLLFAALTCVVLGHYAIRLAPAIGLIEIQRQATPTDLATLVAIGALGFAWIRSRLGHTTNADRIVRTVWMTVAVLAVIIIWGLLSWAIRGGEVATVPPVLERVGIPTSGVLSIVLTIVAGFVGLGRVLPALGSGDGISRIASELQPPRIQGLRRVTVIVGAFALLFTATSSFVFAALVPASSQRIWYETPLLGITQHLVGADRLRNPLTVALAFLAVLLLGYGARIALAGAERTLSRLAQRGLVSETLRRQHPLFGTFAPSLDTAAAIVALAIVAGAGRVSWLASAYAVSLAWILTLKVATLLRLRSRTLAFRVHGNWHVGGREWAIGLWALGGSVVLSVVALVASGDAAAIAASVSLVAVSAVLAVLPSRLERPEEPDDLDRVELVPSAESSLESIEATRGCVLVAVHNPHSLAHLEGALRGAGDRAVIAMTARLLDGDADEVGRDARPGPAEREVLSNALAVAERHQRSVRLLIVPAHDVFDAVITAALRLQAAEVHVGESSTLSAETQARLLGDAWERAAKTGHPGVRLIIYHRSGRTDWFHMGAHAPSLTSRDFDLIHQLWLDAVRSVGPHVHHHDIVRTALTQMAEQLNGPQRDRGLDAIRQTAKPADELASALRTRDYSRLRDTVRNRPPAELAELLAELPIEDQVVAFRLLPRKDAAATFEYLSHEAQETLLKAMAQEDVAALLNEMSPDDRTMFLEELPATVTRQLLTLLTPQERSVAVRLLGYPDKSVGRLMTPEYVAVRADWTVQQVLDHIRTHGQDSETLNVVYVVDEHGQLIDDIRIREFLLTEPTRRVADLMDGRFVALRAIDDQAAAVSAFRQHDRSALPVTDSVGMLIGIVTIDDVLDVAEATATKEIQKIGGSEALDEPYMVIGFWRMIQKRAGWLTALFLGEMLTATAMGAFEAEIERAVVLALFVPLIISSGGNSGSQASTLVIRALALGEVALPDWWRVVRREIGAGLALGGILGSIGFLRITVWSAFSDLYGPYWLLVALTVAFALVGIVLWGTLVGSLLPFVLRRLGFDPATSSAPFVATLVDVTGLVIYFSVALVILRGTLL